MKTNFQLLLILNIMNINHCKPVTRDVQVPDLVQILCGDITRTCKIYGDTSTAASSSLFLLLPLEKLALVTPPSSLLYILRLAVPGARRRLPGGRGQDVHQDGRHQERSCSGHPAPQPSPEEGVWSHSGEHEGSGNILFSFWRFGEDRIKIVELYWSVA